MKVEAKEQETFQPITLTITIESEEELCNLWHRMNVADHILIHSYDVSYKPILQTDLFDVLDELIHKYNIKN